MSVHVRMCMHVLCALNLGKQVHLKNVQVFRACVGF